MHVGFEHVIQPGRPRPFFQCDMQLSPQPMKEIEQSAGFGFNDRLHYQLPGPISNRNHNRFLVHVQPDILDIATPHVATSSGNVTFPPDHFPQGEVSSFRKPTAKMPPLIRTAVELARAERRIGPCREATRAPTQWPPPMQGDDGHPPFNGPLAKEPNIGRGIQALNPGGVAAPHLLAAREKKKKRGGEYNEF